MIESLYTIINGLGRYQIFLCICIFCFQLNTSLNVLCPIFINKQQEIVCQLNASVNDNEISSTELILRNGTNSTNQYTVNQKQCTINYINRACIQLTDVADPMMSTVRTKYRMICENSYLSSTTVLLFMIGIFLGSVFGGFFNDKFGRKKGCIGSYYMMAIFVTMATFAPNIWIYSLARLIVGFATSFSFVSNSGMIVEIVNLQHRSTLGLIWNLGYDTGHLLLVLLAYYIRDEFYLQVSFCCVSYTTLLLPLFYKESFRWLLVKERYKEAKQTMLYIARKNKRNVHSDKIDDFIDEYIKERKMDNIESVSIIEIVKYPTVMICVLCLWFLFFASAFSYYTFVLGSSSVSSNVYRATLMSGVCIWVLRVLFMAICYKLPRTLLLTVLQFTLFLLLVISMIMKYFLGTSSNNVFSSALLMIAVGVSGLNFGYMWIYGGEAFPTVVRATSVSIGSACARMSGIIASQIQWVFEVSPYALPAIGALLASFGTLSAIFILPETFKKQSIDFLPEAENKFVEWRQSWRKPRTIAKEIEIKDEPIHFNSVNSVEKREDVDTF